MENSNRERDEFDRWNTRQTVFQWEHSEKETELREILRTRGVTELDLVPMALSVYETACSERRDQARESSNKVQLESALESRKREESTATEFQNRTMEISSAIKKFAQEIGLVDAED